MLKKGNQQLTKNENEIDETLALDELVKNSSNINVGDEAIKVKDEPAEIKATPKEVEEALARLHMRKKNIQKDKRFLNISFCAMVFIIMFYILTFFIYAAIPASAKRTFDRDIIRITPYTTEEQINRLRADWVTMQNRSDFQQIMHTIDSIKN